jgi:hypothetical protein
LRAGHRHRSRERDLGDARAATDGRGRASLPLGAGGETREVELAVAPAAFVPLKRSAGRVPSPSRTRGSCRSRAALAPKAEAFRRA